MHHGSQLPIILFWIASIDVVDASRYWVTPPDANQTWPDPIVYGDGSWINGWWSEEPAQWASQNVFMFQHPSGSNKTISTASILDNGNRLNSMLWQMSLKDLGLDPANGNEFHLRMCPGSDTFNTDCFDTKPFTVKEGLPITTQSVITAGDDRPYTLGADTTLPPFVDAAVATPTTSVVSTTSVSRTIDTPGPSPTSLIPSPATSASSSPTAAMTSDSDGLPIGAKVGIGIGAAAVAILIFALGFLLARRRKRSVDPVLKQDIHIQREKEWHDHDLGAQPALSGREYKAPVEFLSELDSSRRVAELEGSGGDRR